MTKGETDFRPGVTPPAGSHEEGSSAVLFSRGPHLKRSTFQKEASHVLGK
jgi:hypothetical protein